MWQRYRLELESFLSGNGRVLALIFGMSTLSRKHSSKIYGGFLDELKQLYDGEISTTKTSKSIRILFNWTRLNHLSARRARDGQLSVIPVTDPQSKLCPFCGEHRFHFMTYHLLWSCPMLETSEELFWANNSNNFAGNLVFLEGIQAKIDDL